MTKKQSVGTASPSGFTPAKVANEGTGQPSEKVFEFEQSIQGKRLVAAEAEFYQLHKKAPGSRRQKPED